jgi:hypothetical protein
MYAVRFTGGDPAKRVAEAIASAAGVTAEPLEHPLSEPAELLFAGCRDGLMTPELEHFLSTLDPALIQSVALFQVAALPVSCWQGAAGILADRGIRMRQEEFSCRRELLFVNRGHPDRRDLSAAKEWARKILKKQ